MLCEEKKAYGGPNKVVLSTTGHEYMPNQARCSLVLKKLRFYLVNTRMRSKRDIKMGRLCTPGVQW